MPLEHISLYAYVGIWACSLALALSMWQALLTIGIVNDGLGSCQMLQQTAITGSQILFSSVLLVIYFLVVRFKFKKRIDSSLIVPFVITMAAMMMALFTDSLLRMHLGISDCNGGGGGINETQLFYTFCAVTVGITVYVMVRVVVQ